VNKQVAIKVWIDSMSMEIFILSLLKVERRCKHERSAVAIRRLDSDLHYRRRFRYEKCSEESNVSANEDQGGAIIAESMHCQVSRAACQTCVVDIIIRLASV
jgi:hypothetical protein